MTRRLLWSNAGTVFEGFARHLETAAAGRAGLDQARALLASARLADGGRNPLFEPVRYQEGQRIRRICCLRYLIPDRKLCELCPLPASSPARILSNGME